MEQTPEPPAPNTAKRKWALSAPTSAFLLVGAVLFFLWPHSALLQDFALTLFLGISILIGAMCSPSRYHCSHCRASVAPRQRFCGNCQSHLRK